MTNRQRKLAVSAKAVRAALEAVFAGEGRGEPDLAVRIVNDAEIRALNARWLGHDWATDAITFSYEGDPSPDGLRGEVVVSAETALREARSRGGDPEQELLLYVAHGALHLLGWDDDTPARRRAMNARARRLLAAPGSARPARRSSRRATAAARSRRGARR
ncbi:MAG: rRNA maturation RNase YbeY [Planctomycetota bacterium]